MTGVAGNRGACHSSGMGLNIAFAALSAAFAIQSAFAAQAPLKPSGPWNVEYADNMCILAREFGEGDAKVTLGFRPGVFSEHIRVVLVEAGKGNEVVRGEAQLAFDANAPLKARYIQQFNQRREQRVVMIDLQQPDLAPLENARQFWVRVGKREYLLAPDTVPAAMKALEECEKDLLATWGMAPETVASIATFPKGRVTAIFHFNDYPMSALTKREQGIAGVRFWVTKDGTVRDCRIVESSGSGTLDAKTCEIVTRRGRLDPARTKSGEIIECLSFVRVRWEIHG